MLEFEIFGSPPDVDFWWLPIQMLEFETSLIFLKMYKLSWYAYELK